RIAGQGEVQSGAEPVARRREEADAPVAGIEGGKGVPDPGQGVEGVELARAVSAPPDRAQVCAVGAEHPDLVRLHIRYVDVAPGVGDDRAHHPELVGPRVAGVVAGTDPGARLDFEDPRSAESTDVLHAADGV